MSDLDTRTLQLITKGKSLLSEYRNCDWDNQPKLAKTIRSFLRRLREISHHLKWEDKLHDCLTLYSLAQELIQTIRDQGSELDGVLLHDLGTVYTALGQYSEVLRYLQQSIQIQEEEGTRLGVAIALSSLGRLYQKVQRYEEALDCFEQALKRVPALGGCWIAKGGVLEAMGRREEAIASYHRALRIRRWHNEARGALQRLGIDVDNES